MKIKYILKNTQFIIKELLKPIDKERIIKAYKAIVLRVDRFVMEGFHKEGERSGFPKWQAFSELTLHPAWKAKNSSFPETKGYRYNPDKWRKRPGTDEASSRRYSSISKLNQASGGIRQSFSPKMITAEKAIYGSFKEVAKMIHEGHGFAPARPLLRLSGKDNETIKEIYRSFVLVRL